MADINPQTFTLMNASLDRIEKGQSEINKKIEGNYKSVHERITKEWNSMNKRMVRQEVWRNRAIGFMTAITVVIVPVILWIVRYQYLMSKG